MPSNHESIGIAQTIFYVPAIPVTLYILVKNWPIGPRISRLSWLTLAILSLMRFTGGILVIVRESQPDNAALAIATVVILNVGLVPLIMSTLGMVGLVLSASADKHALIQKTMMVFRLLFITALTLLIGGGGGELSAWTDTQLVIIFFKLPSEEQTSPRVNMYLRGATIVIPFLILRIVYGVLSAFLTPYTWSPLIGSPVAFALMALLPEYLTIASYAYLGLHRFREHAAGAEMEVGDDVDQTHKQEQVIDVNKGKGVENPDCEG